MAGISNHVLKVSSGAQNTRKNFGDSSARNSGEADFMSAFERAYFARTASTGVAADEFCVAGFGIADLVWIGWKPDPASEEFTALAFEKRVSRHHLHAFEGKLKDWRRALQQAFRYRYFADKAIVVMPYNSSNPALANLEAFRHAGVGFWSFDAAAGTIRQHYTPTRIRAFSPEARQKAIRMLSSKFDLSQFRK